MSCPLDGENELPLVVRTRSGDALGNDASLLRNATRQTFLVLVVNVRVFGVAESARALLALLVARLITLTRARLSRPSAAEWWASSAKSWPSAGSWPTHAGSAACS